MLWRWMGSDRGECCRQYQQLLSQVQADTYETSQDLYLNSRLREVIEKLEKKVRISRLLFAVLSLMWFKIKQGQQLDMLRKYQRSISQRMARMSPATPASTEKRLHALQLLQSLRASVLSS
jgi:hypothetical protein